MKRNILTSILLALILLLSACGPRVSVEQYNELVNKCNRLEAELAAINTKRAEALAYTEFLDILLYPYWDEGGVGSRFEIQSKLAYGLKLSDRALELNDKKLTNYIVAMSLGDEDALYQAMYYCFEKIKANLK